jgi:hypothetical protein
MDHKLNDPTSKRTRLTVKEAKAAGLRRFVGEDKIPKGPSPRSIFFADNWKAFDKKKLVGVTDKKQRTKIRRDHFSAEVRRISALWRASGQCGVKKAKSSPKKASGKRAKKASGKKACK